MPAQKKSLIGGQNVKKIKWHNIILYCLRSAFYSSKPYTIFRIMIKAILPVVTLLSTYITSVITNALVNQASNAADIDFFLILMALLFIVRLLSMVLNNIHAFITQNHNELLEKDINIRIMETCMTSDMEMFDNPEYYDQIGLAKRDSQAVINILWNVLDFISAFISFITVFVIILSSELVPAIIIVISSIPAAIITHHVTQKAYELHVKQANEEREKYYYSEIASEKNFSQLLRINNMSEWIKMKYYNVWRKLFIGKKTMRKKNYEIESIINISPEIAIVISMTIVGSKVLYGQYTIGSFTLYSGLFIQLYSQITLAIENAMSIYDSKMKVENIMLLNNTPRKIVSGNVPIECIESIEFKDVSFSYPSSNSCVLTSINFKVNKGEKVALVGINGSGKSTILKLMLRLYDPTSGCILINNQNIKTYKIADLYGCLDCYFQNSRNLPFSIRKNVDIRSNTDSALRDPQIAEALDHGYAQDIVNMCHGDLSTHITRLFSTYGIELSEGQHQKIAISRVFFSQKSLVLFDEPSSSLDPEAEDEIFRAVGRLFAEKTVFFTSHRLTNLFLADKILVLENGKIIESGTKEELMRSKSRFFNLYQYQAEKFND